MKFLKQLDRWLDTYPLEMLLISMVIMSVMFFVAYASLAPYSRFQVVSSKSRTFMVDGIDSPKHFYLDVTDTQTSQSYKYIYISKHFNEWERLKVGAIISANLATVSDGKTTKTEPRINYDDVVSALAE